VYAGEEDHAQPGWTTLIRGRTLHGRVNQNDRDKWSDVVWSTLRPRTAKEQNSLVHNSMYSKRETSTGTQ